MSKKIVISGFDAFDGDIMNPSTELINWLRIRKNGNEKNINSIILPVVFDEAFIRLKEVVDEFCPDVIVLTGYAKNRKNLTVERIGINWVDARIPDNNGNIKTSQRIDEGGPDGLFTTIDISRLIELVQLSGLELKVSTSAGEYVCNEVLYRTLCYVKDKKIEVTFIHIPTLDNYDNTFLAFESILNDL